MQPDSEVRKMPAWGNARQANQARQRRRMIRRNNRQASRKWKATQHINVKPMLDTQTGEWLIH